MDQKLLRNVGITVGAAALAAALGVATLTGDPAAPPEFEPTIAGPVQSTPTPSADATPAAAPGEAVFETADSEDAPPVAAAALTFLVRFRGTGPLGRAQTLAGEGRDAEARRAAEAALSRQAGLRGLCFDRFTLGGAEMVLRTCAPVPAADQTQVRDRWLPRLRVMPGVAYAEVNAIAATDRTP